MTERTWVNRHQPQTLHSAVVLGYIRGASIFLFGGVVARHLTEPVLGDSLARLAPLAMALAFAVGAYATANDRTWGFWLSAAAAVCSTFGTLWWAVDVDFGINVLIRLAFDVAMVVLLFHPHSREYRRIWFR
ncbi:MAG TPA: hypothetical protein DEP66_03990 [Acidimicrobiaceae bacterium]|nr:hypothetical protein [Acidimicrobiaceae bacterium]HCB37366.1 hypothetical protein [Acidimicrobiaceae bacterium]